MKEDTPSASSRQLFLDLDFSPPEMDEQEIDAELSLRLTDLYRASVAWLTQQDAAGIGLKVPTRISRFRADLAAFWNRAHRTKDWRGPHRLLSPCHTMIIECRRKRQDCWPDFTRSDELLPRLRELKAERRDLETEIRANEPQLRRTDTLFDEYSEWDYTQTSNTHYLDVLREIDKLNKALYKGTRFESIRQAHLADFLYLAVPEKTVHPNELADGWGLLWVKPDLSTELVVQAESEECPPENHFHLVQNIASASLSQVLFNQGIYAEGDDLVFVSKPRGRRPRPGDPRLKG